MGEDLRMFAKPRPAAQTVALAGRLHPDLGRARGPPGTPEALLRAGPGFLSAEQLLEQVWDENADPFTNTVTVTIGRLRRKPGAPPVITTTPGVGYRITAAR